MELKIHSELNCLETLSLAPRCLSDRLGNIVLFSLKLQCRPTFKNPLCPRSGVLRASRVASVLGLFYAFHIACVLHCITLEVRPGFMYTGCTVPEQISCPRNKGVVVFIMDASGHSTQTCCVCLDSFGVFTQMTWRHNFDMTGMYFTIV